MTVPFGFSVGDVIAGINLLITSINAVKDSTGTSSEYRAVPATLDQVSFVLEGLNELQLDDTLYYYVAASKCGTTIFQFFSKISKYKASLESPRSVKSWKVVLKKIEWSLYSKDDIRRFQAQLQGDLNALHTTLQRINLAINLANTRATQSALLQVESRLDQANTTQQLILQALSWCIEEFRGLLMIVFLNNISVINFLLSSQQLFAQVQDERPTYLDDPHGRIVPIQTSWIENWDDFESLLKFQFRRVPGLRKILRREYVLHDTVRFGEIAQSMPAESVFRPGRRIVMFMVSEGYRLPQLCPKCFKALNGIRAHGTKVRSPCLSNHCTIQADNGEDTGISTFTTVIPIWEYEKWLRSTSLTLRGTNISRAVRKVTERKLEFSWDCDMAFARRRVVSLLRERIYYHNPKRQLESASPSTNDIGGLRISGDDALVTRLHQYAMNHRDHDRHLDAQRLLEELLPLDVDHGYRDAVREFSHTIVREAITLY